MSDLTDKKDGKIFRDFANYDMSADCPNPSGVITTTWVEAGMIAHSYVKSRTPLCLELVDE